MKRVSMMRSRDPLLHIETPLGIINIRVGLHDSQGRRVESIEVIPNDYCGDPAVRLRGRHNTRLVELKTVGGGK
jgi:hypothetical protein